MALTKATFSMVSGSVANVLDYGAVGDGATDDTAAIQAALDASTEVFIPAGVYMTKKLTLSKFGQVLRGAGINGSGSTGTTLKLIAGEATEIINTNAQSQIVIKDMTLWGNGANGVPATSGARGLVMKNSYTCRVQNVYVLYTDDWGVVVDECNNIELEEVIVSNVEGGGLLVTGTTLPVAIKWNNGGVENYKGDQGVRLEAGYNHILSGLWIECGVNGSTYYVASASQRAIWIDANQTIVENCNIKNVGGDGLNGIFTENCVRCMFIGNVINNVSSDEVLFGTGSDKHYYFGPTAYVNAFAGTHWIAEGSAIDNLSVNTFSIGTTTNNAYVDLNAFVFYRNPGTAFFQHITGTASGTSYGDFVYGGVKIGSISQNGTTAVAYNTSSDYRLKEDWQPMTGAIDRVKALNPVNFAWKADGTRVDGFVAHEVQAVVPEAVTGEKDAIDADGNPDYQGIDQSKLVPLLTAALQEAIARIETLEAK